MRWWQERCLEWCFARYEDGKFGDQVYLDQWPTLFGDRVHVVRQVEKTLAPWNVRHFAKKTRSRLEPVFYHFHALRLLAARREARLSSKVLSRGCSGTGNLRRLCGGVGGGVRAIRSCGDSASHAGPASRAFRLAEDARTTTEWNRTVRKNPVSVRQRIPAAAARVESGSSQKPARAEIVRGDDCDGGRQPDAQIIREFDVPGFSQRSHECRGRAASHCHGQRNRDRSALTPGSQRIGVGLSSRRSSPRARPPR